MSGGCCTECGGITLFGGKDGATIHSGSGSPNVGNPNLGDYYIDTDNWEIYGPYDGSWGTGVSLIGPQGIQGNGIDSIDWASNSAGSPQGTEGTTDTYTITYDDATTDTFEVYNGADGADGADSNSDYGNTLFVDRSFGNDTTGTREKFDLPYRTIAGALSDAVSGDNIIVRAGTYSGNVILKDGVDIYFEQNTIMKGQITDNGDSVNCVIDGYLKLDRNNNAITFTGSNSNISCTLDCVEGTNTPLLVRPVEEGTPEANVVFNINKLIGATSNYSITIYGNANVTINIKEKIETPTFTNSTLGFAVCFLGGDFRGRFVLKSPYVYIGNATNDGGGILLLEDSLNVNDSDIFIDIDKFECDYDYATPSGIGIIEKIGNSRAIINIKEFKSKVRTPIKVSGDNLNGSLIFNGRVYSENYPCVYYRSSQKTVLSGVFKRGSGVLIANAAVTIMAGVNTDYGGITGPDTNWKLYLKSATVIKDGGSGDPGTSGEIVSKRTSDEPIYIVDSKIELQGNGTPDAISGSGTSDGDFYVRNTTGNVDVGTDFTNIATGGTLYVHDTEFKQFEDQ